MAIVEKCWGDDDGGPRVQDWVRNAAVVGDGNQGVAAGGIDVGRNADSAQERAAGALDDGAVAGAGADAGAAGAAGAVAGVAIAALGPR